MAKGTKLGPRVAVSWGSKKIKVKGKTVTVPLVSMMSESVFKRTKLQEYKFAATLKITKDKKGKERIASQGVTRSATKYVLAWFGDLSDACLGVRSGREEKFLPICQNQPRVGLWQLTSRVKTR
jgi:hypothetical protein